MPAFRFPDDFNSRLMGFAVEQPHHPALRTETGIITWRAFAARVQRRRHWIRANGLRQGSRLLIEGAADPELVATVVACLIDGVVFILVDQTLPGPRKAIMERESAPDLRITLPPDTPSPAMESPPLPAPSPGQDAPAYIFFTSGTTGLPKAVLGRRSGLLHFLLWEKGLLSVGAQDRIACLTGLSFDVVLRDLLLPVISGATLCLPPRDLPRDGRSVFDWLERNGITILHAVPSLAQSWLGASGRSCRAPLRHCLFAGEPLRETLVVAWKRLFPRTVLHNLYGPTETTLAKVHHRVADTPHPGIQPCGRPLPEVDVIVCNEDGGPSHPGEVGEISIRTRYASLGYLNAPEENASRFRRDGPDVIYRTGDLGRVDQDGVLHLLGRSDFQIKINGVRIEPEGIAAELEAHPAVRAAVVIGRRTERDTCTLDAFHVSAGDDDLSDALRRHLLERLPAVMVPGSFTRLESLPLTPNGKLDRNRLVRPVVRDPAEAARSSTEQSLVEIWRAVLGMSEIGPTDNFFACGGDSLAAVEIALRIEDTLSCRVAPASFIDAPTPRAMAGLVDAGASCGTVRIPEADDRQCHPLSPSQLRYFRQFCASGDQSWSNMVAVFPLPAGTCRRAVEDALGRIARRHESLRIRLSRVGGEVIQEFLDDVPIALDEADFSGFAEAEREAAFEALRLSESEWPIPLGSTPLFRGTFVRFGEDDVRLLWNVHHMISDGTSQGLLRSELMEILEADSRNRPPELPPIETRFRDWAAWRNTFSGHEDHRAARDHWVRLHRGGRHDLRLSYRPGPTPQRCHSWNFSLADRTRAAIHELARSARTTPFIVFLAGYYLMLHAATGHDDLVIASPLSGRTERSIETSIGNYINLITTRSRTTTIRSAADLVEDLHRQMGLAARHQAFQFDTLVEDLGLPFDPDRNPLTPFSLNFMPQTTAHGPAIPPSHRDMGYTLRYDLLFLIRDHPDRTVIEIQYRVGAFLQDDIVRMSSAWESCLASLDLHAAPSEILRSLKARLPDIRLDASALAGSELRSTETAS